MITESDPFPRPRLRTHLDGVATSGVAVVRGAVPPSILEPLLDEIDTLPFTTPPADVLPVAYGSDLSVLRCWSGGYPALTTLHDYLVDQIRRAGDGIPGLGNWRPNEIFVRRYDPASPGMSPHVDGLRFRYLVATVTVCGTATFRVHDDAGTIRRQWDIGPGDLVLLRGPGLGGLPDGRHRHSVGAPGPGTRCSVAFRMSLSA